ncbi:MAG: phage tail protein [Amycolatopsis sp.]|jgi:hypothetical protein|uniref:phage distal tail protein n=1 Tax=Amycolatopsis sp. TaxID=37632 RepID=UPI002613947F|nr:hypothetical protein [Amycolatopsis sp.]MCU1680932.1 phage tail protein [Amycolatopsis sp.]
MPAVLTYPTYSINGWNAGVLDDNNAMWGVSSQDALNMPAPRMRTSPKPYADGSFRAPSFRDSRTVTLTGWCATQGRVTARQARDLIARAFPDGGQQLFTMDDGVAARTVLVELASEVKIAFGGNPYLFQWQFSVWAADGRYLDANVQTAVTSLPIFGNGLDWSTGGGLDWSTGGGLNWGSVSSSGSFVMQNTGTAQSWPVFTFAGPLTLPVLTNTGTGAQIAYADTLGASDNVVIVTDPEIRSVALNGSDRFTLLSAAQWFSIPPGGSVTVSLAASGGSGTLSASWQNASW